MRWEAQRGAVVWRETTRAARRWQTYAGRSGFSALLLGVLVVGIWGATYASSADWFGSGESAMLGRALFVLFTSIQLLIALVMAPVATSRAVIEERVEGTLELLVLTPLTLPTLLLGKLASRVLVLGMIVLGSVPLMALAVTLGGVAVEEVVLATLGNAVTLVVMGVVGAFFGLFTRSPLLAGLAAMGWALLAFLGLPGPFALLIGDAGGTAQVSPFFSSLGGWSGLVLPLMWVPTVLMTFLLTARLFGLRVANAAVGRYFEPEVWYGRTVLWGFVAFVVASCTILPVGVALCWSVQGSSTLVSSVVFVLGWILCAAWTQGVMLLSTWMYLRLGMDLTDALESLLDGVGAQRAAMRRSLGERIGRNPVRWREGRASAWGRGALPVLSIWGIAMLALLQAFVWLVPGGALALGLGNAALGIGMAVWIGVGSIEQERRGRSLDLLRVSTLSSRAIVLGKLAGLTRPSLPLVSFGAALVVVGVPHARTIELVELAFKADATEQLVLSLVHGVLAAVWLHALWLALAGLGLVLALRMKNPGSAYLATGAVALVGVLVPAFLAWTLSGWGWLAVPFRALAGPAAPGLPFGETLFGIVALTATGVGLLALATARLRTWGGDL